MSVKGHPMVHFIVFVFFLCLAKAAGASPTLTGTNLHISRNSSISNEEIVCVDTTRDQKWDGWLSVSDCQASLANLKKMFDVWKVQEFWFYSGKDHEPAERTIWALPDHFPGYREYL